MSQTLSSDTAVAIPGTASPLRGGLRLSGYSRDILSVLSGALLGKLLTVAATPVLTRLFDPVAYGLFGLFSSITAVVTVLGCMGYQRALVMPRDSRHAAALLQLSLAILLSVSALCVILVIGHAVQPSLPTTYSPLLIWMPLALLSTGAYELFEYWHARTRQFAVVSVAHVTRSASMVAIQLGAGLAIATAEGLIWGYVLGHTLACTWFIVSIWRTDRTVLTRLTARREIAATAGLYRDFPLFTVPANLLSRFRGALLPLALSACFAPAVVGHYWLTQRLVALVNLTIGRSLRQVFFQRASALSTSNQPLGGLLLRNTLALALAGLAPTLVLAAAGPNLFEYLLGSPWREAGTYARWIAILGFAQFVNAPALELVYVFRLQRWHLFFEGLLLAGQAAAVIAGAVKGDALLAIMLSSLIGSAICVVQVCLVTWHTMTREPRLRSAPSDALATWPAGMLGLHPQKNRQ